MTALVVPGVRVEARFDVLPPLPAPSGIVGVVGIVDRPPSERGPIGVTKLGELREILGPGTETSLPEAVHALANGASEVVVSPVLNGAPATCALLNAQSAQAVVLRCRSNGAWGNSLRGEVRAIGNAAGDIVRVSLRLLLGGKTVEAFDDLVVSPGAPDDLFETINRRSRYVIAVDPGFSGALPAENTYSFNEEGSPVDVLETSPGTRPLMQLIPADGVAPSGLSVRIQVSSGKIQVRVFQGGLQEEHVNLVMNPDSERYLPYHLINQSRLIRVRPLSSLAEGRRLPAATTTLAVFAEGSSPSVADYRDAIDLLSDDPRIDLVLASVEPGRTSAEVHQIHQALVAHAVAMADAGAPRIAFGSVTEDEHKNLAMIRDHAAAVRNRRLVLVAPPHAEGAVAGMIGRMRPEESPTFKPATLFGIEPAKYRESELNRLLGPTTNLLVVQDRVGRGVIVLKGIDLTGDQISVTRVADVCIRETKATAENFIGRLNTEEARIALREQITATFTRMEREGALVKSTDGKDPAFVVDVFSTQQDFAQGIVRVDIAVRPVRAIDYVYASIRVKN